MASYRILKKSLKGKVSFGEPLSMHTTFRIGGPAKIWVEPDDEEDLKKVLRFAKKRNLKTFIIGFGSNVLADDKGFDGIAIRFSSPNFKKIHFEKTKVRAGSGLAVISLVLSCCRHSLGGLECLVGIPGTVGGAVRMNAGYKKNIGELINSVRVMDKNGRIKTLYKKDLKFGYRRSNLSSYIALEAEFNLKRSPKSSIVKSCNDLIKSKRQTQPLNKRSAGCVFKNPEGRKYPAGRLIDLCGLKGAKMGGARISSKHANFIINETRATSKDVVNLMNLAKKKVREKFGVCLEPEIIRL